MTCSRNFADNGKYMYMYTCVMSKVNGFWAGKGRRTDKSISPSLLYCSMLMRESLVG